MLGAVDGTVVMAVGPEARVCVEESAAMWEAREGAELWPRQPSAET
jgi:hypothetical protein